jgi:hypothetical protein
MRIDAERIAAYLAKTVPSTVSLKVASQLATMKTGFSAGIGGVDGLVATEVAIQTILNDQPTPAVPTIQYPYYMNFGREIWARKHAGIDGAALKDNAEVYRIKYIAYGLVEAILDEIGLTCFGLTFTGLP